MGMVDPKNTKIGILKHYRLKPNCKKFLYDLKTSQKHFGGKILKTRRSKFFFIDPITKITFWVRFPSIFLFTALQKAYRWAWLIEKIFNY